MNKRPKNNGKAKKYHRNLSYGTMKRATEKLGISAPTLRKRLLEYDIEALTIVEAIERETEKQREKDMKMLRNESRLKRLAFVNTQIENLMQLKTTLEQGV